MEPNQNIDAGTPAPPPIPAGATPPAAPPPEPAPQAAPAAEPAAPAFDLKAAGGHIWDAMDEDLRGWYETRGLNRDNFDVVEVAKQRREAQKLAARKGVPLPNDDADEEGWGQVWDALGVPKDPAGYEIKTDDPAQKAQADAVAKLYHDAKLTPKQARALTEGTLALQQQQQQAAADQQSAAEAERAETVRRETAELQAEWGTKWDANDQAAGRAIQALGLNEDAVKAITAQVGYKQMMLTLAALGNAAGEATFHGGSGNSPAPGSMSPAGARAKLAEIGQDKDFQARIFSKDRNVHGAAQRELENLQRLAFG